MSDASVRPAPKRNLIATLFLIGFGAVAIAWGTATLQTFWALSSVSRIATLILGGQSFNWESLQNLTPKMDGIDRQADGSPEALRAAAVVELKIAEQTLARGEREGIDARLTALHSAVRHSLAETPADPFLWFVLFWLENTQNGYVADHLKFLRLSYLYGPNEGWIGLRRNRYTLAIFPVLPPDIAERGTTEFLALLRSGFYLETANIFRGPGWQVRQLLLPQLKSVPGYHRNIFAKYLYDWGYDVPIPGVDPPKPTRPWQ